MTNRSAWTAGNGQGLTWGNLFNGSDLNSLPNGDSVLSSIAAIANGGNLDQFMDVSLECSISSSTIAAGANFAFWIFYLQQDGSTYGDGSLTAGTQAAVTPGLFPAFTIPLRAASSVTSLVGDNGTQPILIRPQSFLVVIQNNSGFTLSSSGNTIKFKTYNINLNN